MGVCDVVPGRDAGGKTAGAVMLQAERQGFSFYFGLLLGRSPSWIERMKNR